VDAGQPAEQLRVIVNQRGEPVVDRLEVRLDQRQVIGVDPAERPGLSVVEYRSELGECSVRRVGIERRGQFGRREVEPGIAVLDTQRLKNGSCSMVLMMSRCAARKAASAPASLFTAPGTLAMRS
jgi:hypothetical protein